MKTYNLTHVVSLTRTRLETIQEQVRYLLLYGGIDEADIDTLLVGVEKSQVEAIGVFAKDNSRSRIVEVELAIDWDVSAELTLSVPDIMGDLPGWRDRQAPEIRVVGKRFAEVVKRLGLKTSYWVRFTSSVRADDTLHKSLCEEYGLNYEFEAPRVEGVSN